MNVPTKRKRARKARSVDSAVQRYEALKAEFRRMALTPAEYAKACLEAARRARL